MGSKRLFGTDGIRGTAGEAPLDAATVRRVGSALVEILKPRTGEPRILLGRDTRESGEALAEDLGRGIAAAGGHAVCMGVAPTPAVAALTRARGFDAGVVISASHNPYRDNGIKILSAEGFKLPDEEEARIEGTVVDTDGLGVAGADVYLTAMVSRSGDADPIASTDANGRFRLRGCEASCYIGARAFGHTQAPMRLVAAHVGATASVRRSKPS